MIGLLIELFWLVLSKYTVNNLSTVHHRAFRLVIRATLDRYLIYFYWWPWVIWYKVNFDLSRELLFLSWRLKIWNVKPPYIFVKAILWKIIKMGNKLWVMNGVLLKRHSRYYKNLSWGIISLECKTHIYPWILLNWFVEESHNRCNRCGNQSNWNTWRNGEHFA